SVGPDKVRITNVYSLPQYRDVFADLWLDIVKGLPAANGAAPDTLKGTPRADRQQVFIESINSRYAPDIGQSLTADNNELKLNAQRSLEKVGASSNASVEAA